MLREDEKRKQRLRHFNADERRYVLLCLADGKSLPQVVNDFQNRFPDFSCGVDRTALKRKLYERVRNIKRNHPQDVQAIAELTRVDIIKLPDSDDFRAIAKLPIADFISDFGDVDAIFRGLYRLWIEVPAKDLIDVCLDSTGAERKIYKFLTRERVQILADVREHIHRLPESCIPQHVPITDPMFRFMALEQLLCETPIKSFLRYSRKLGKDVYRYYVKDLIKVIQQARIESEDLPEPYKEITFPQTKTARAKILKLRAVAESIDATYDG